MSAHFRQVYVDSTGMLVTIRLNSSLVTWSILFKWQKEQICELDVIVLCSQTLTWGGRESGQTGILSWCSTVSNSVGN